MKYLKSALVTAILLIVVGCGTRTISVSPTDPVRLARDVENVPAWVKGADGKEVKTTVTLKEGSYNLTREAHEKKAEKPKEPVGEVAPIPEKPKA